jgi:hypothetical protein
MPGWPSTGSTGLEGELGCEAAFAVVGGFLAGFVIAGQRAAGPAERPLGRPGERPAGFGAAAGEPSVAGSGGNPRRTRPGPPVGLLPTARPRVVQPRVCWRSGRCVPGRTCGHRPATQGRDPAASPRARPPQPPHLGRARLGGDAFDLDADQGAAPARPGTAAAVAGVALLLGCGPAQACTVTVPSWSSTVTRVAVGAGQVTGSAQANVAPWRRGRPVLPGGGGGVQATVGAQPPQHRHPLLGRVQGELGGIVAGVQDEQRHRPASSSRPSSARTCAAAVWSVSSAGCSRVASTGAVQASRARPKPAIHREAQPAMIGCPAECRKG